jgi:hypothetical protein
MVSDLRKFHKYLNYKLLSFFVQNTNTMSSAPIVYLYSGEEYFPSDIGAQVSNTQPEINYEVVSGAPSPLTLDNLDSLNALGGSSIYLTSKVDTTNPQPEWLKGVVPDSTGKTNGAVSCSIIVNDYGNGTVDAFYMYFYAYVLPPPYLPFAQADREIATTGAAKS